MVLTVFAGMAEFERALESGLFAVLGVGLLR